MASEKNENLKKSALGGMFWVFVGRMSGKLVSLVVAIVLARLLLPEDYSIINIVTIFYMFCTVVVTCGQNTALIQKKDADELDYATALCITLSAAVVMYAVVFFCAPLVSRLYNKPQLVPVFRVMGLSLFIFAVKTVLNAYNFSDLQFRRFFAATMSGGITSAVVGITMAYMGFGVWALVAQQMVDLFVDTTVLYHTCKVKLRLKFTKERVHGLMNLGWKNFVSHMIATIYNEINPLFIGLRFSATDLAFYTKGRSFPGLINTTLSEAMSLVLFPVLTKVRDNSDDIRGAVRRYMKTATYVIFPVMLGLFAIADTFVRVALTEKWMEAVSYIRIFCVSYMITLVNAGNLEVIRALGRSDIILKLEIQKRIISLVLLAVFLIFSKSPQMIGICTVATGLVATVLNAAPNRQLIGYRVRWMLADVLPNLLLGSAMAAIVMLTGLLPIPGLLLLLVQILVGGAVYCLASILLKIESFRYLLKTVKQMLHK